MRARAAYISSVGTTTILVGAALFMLGVVSTLVAFRGWPGDGAGDGVTSVPLDVPPQKAKLVRKVRGTAAVNAARRIAVTSRAAGARSSTGGLVKMRRPKRVGLLFESPPPGAAPAPAPAPAPRPVAPAPPEAPAPPPDAPALPTPGDVQEVVDGLVESAPPIALPVAGVEVPLP